MKVQPFLLVVWELIKLPFLLFINLLLNSYNMEKILILYIWNTTNEPFGVFESHEFANTYIENLARLIGTTPENLKADLYLYEVPLNSHYIDSLSIR